MTSKSRRWSRPIPTSTPTATTPGSILHRLRRDAEAIGIDLGPYDDIRLGAALMRAQAAHGPGSPNPNEQAMMAEFLERLSTGRSGA